LPFFPLAIKHLTRKKWHLSSCHFERGAITQSLAIMLNGESTQRAQLGSTDI
jgi:hypothetical protein